MSYPSMIRVRQNFKTSPIKNIEGKVSIELKRIKVREIIAPGDSVAITAGSRGIANLATVLAEIIRELKEMGAKPFIVPAMGSHGGATPEGQKKILQNYGITEKRIRAPIRSSLSVVQVGSTAAGTPVFLDRNASYADHIVVVNRVKPHTDFSADIESGLMKMMAIGLGKQKGADHYHTVFLELGHHRVIVSVAREILKKCPIAFGVALVENQRDETEIIRAVLPAEIEETEQKLLIEAKRMFPQIPVGPIDILIIDKMGKEISGTGMDQKVIGRSVVRNHRVTARPDILRIFVRDLTPGSNGNAVGIGNADFTTKRLVEKIDRHATYINCMTSSAPEIVRIPPYFKNDREALQTALNTIGDITPEKARIVHIRDTLRLEEIHISEALLPKAEQMEGLRIVGNLFPMTFDKKGNLSDIE